MKSAIGFLKGLHGFTFLLACTICVQASGASSQAQPGIQNIYNKLPLAFEINQGQTHDQVKFLTRGSGYTFFLTAQEAVLSLSHTIQSRASESGLLKSTSSTGTEVNSVLRMTWLGGNPSPPVTGEAELPSKVNYFRGEQSRRLVHEPEHFRAGALSQYL